MVQTLEICFEFAAPSTPSGGQIRYNDVHYIDVYYQWELTSCAEDK